MFNPLKYFIRHPGPLLFFGHLRESSFSVGLVTSCGQSYTPLGWLEISGTEDIDHKFTAVQGYPPLLDCESLDRWLAHPLVGLDDLCTAGGATRGGCFRAVVASVARGSWF